MSTSPVSLNSLLNGFFSTGKPSIAGHSGNSGLGPSARPFSAWLQPQQISLSLVSNTKITAKQRENRLKTGVEGGNYHGWRLSAGELSPKRKIIAFACWAFVDS